MLTRLLTVLLLPVPLLSWLVLLIPLLLLMVPLPPVLLLLSGQLLPLLKREAPLLQAAYNLPSESCVAWGSARSRAIRFRSRGIQTAGRDT